jgi:4-amino-4-deoxy-L-arabinose transferase-like glycosyltransferase
MVDGLAKVSWRRILTNLAGLAVAMALVAGLVAARGCARRGDGGLTMTLWATTQPGQSDRPLVKAVRPTVDLDAQEGPHWPPAARSVRYDGWIYIPHRGHFVLALGLRGQAQLTLDDGQTRVIRARSGPITTEHGHRVHPRRIHKEQRLLARGWHRLRLEAQLPRGTGSIRLFWLPPGRRGVVEYVEPAMVRPDGPRPQTPGHAGPAPRDPWVALGLLAVLALLVAFWARRPLVSWARTLRTVPEARLEFATLVGLFTVALAARLWGLGDAGQTWDEDVYFSAGRNQWLNLLATDFRASSWQWNLEHPPVSRYLIGLGALFGEHLNTARTVSAVVGALVVPVTYLAGRDLFRDRRVGVVAAAVAVVLPTLLAHAQVAGHESPSVLLYTLTCYFMFRALMAKGDAPGALLATAVFGGLLVSCRLVNLTAWFFVAALALWIAIPRIRKSQPLPGAMLLMPLAAGAIFLLVWPRLWSSPARHLGELLTYWHPDVVQKEFFWGKQIRTSWAYFPLYALVTTPTAVLGGLALFGARLGWHRGRAEAVIALWILAPLAATPLVPFHRDGLRYVLPVVVPILLAAAAGTVWLVDTLTSRWRTFNAWRPGPWLVAILALAALAGPTAWAAHRIHPYYLDFYNAPSGGGQAALEQRRFEWSWWGEGLAGSVQFLRRHAKPPARVGMDVPARHTVVLHPDVKTTGPGTRPAPDFLLYAGEGLRRLWDQKAHRWRHPPGYRVVHEERAEGVPLSRVYQRQ